jgi:hypothetical protein
MWSGEEKRDEMERDRAVQGVQGSGVDAICGGLRCGVEHQATNADLTESRDNELTRLGLLCTVAYPLWRYGFI